MKTYTTSSQYNTASQFEQVVHDFKNQHVWIDKQYTGSGGTTAYHDYVSNQSPENNYALIEQNRIVAHDKAKQWTRKGLCNINLYSTDKHSFNTIREEHDKTLPTLDIFVVDSFLKNLENNKKYETILVDESHAIITESEYRTSLISLPQRLPKDTTVLFITATPLHKCGVTFKTSAPKKLAVQSTVHKNYQTIPTDWLIDHIDNLDDDTGLIIYAPSTRDIFGIYALLKDRTDVSFGVGPTAQKRALQTMVPDTLLTSRLNPKKRILVLTKTAKEGFDAETYLKYNIIAVADQCNSRTAMTNAELTQVIGRCRTTLNEINVFEKGEYTPKNNVGKLCGLNGGRMSKLLIDAQDHSDFLLSDLYSPIQKASANSKTKFHINPRRFNTNDNWGNYTITHKGMLLSKLPRIMLTINMMNFDPKACLRLPLLKERMKSEEPSYVRLETEAYQIKTFMSFKPRSLYIGPDGYFKSDDKSYQTIIWLSEVNGITLSKYFNEHCNTSRPVTGLKDLKRLRKKGKLKDNTFSDYFIELATAVMGLIIAIDINAKNSIYYKILADQINIISIIQTDFDKIILNTGTIFKEKLDRYGKELKKVKDVCRKKPTEFNEKNIKTVENKIAQYSDDNIENKVALMLFTLYGIYDYGSYKKQFRVYNGMTLVGGGPIKDIIENYSQYSMIPVDLNQIAPKIAKIITGTPEDFSKDLYQAYFKNPFMDDADRRLGKIEVNKFLNSCNTRSNQRTVCKGKFDTRESRKLFKDLTKLGADGAFFQTYTAVEQIILTIIKRLSSHEAMVPRLHDAIYLKEDLMVAKGVISDPNISFTVDGVPYGDGAFYNGWVDNGTPSDQCYTIHITTTPKGAKIADYENVPNHLFKLNESNELKQLKYDMKLFGFWRKK